MKGIYERGHIPIVVGGTGFYIQALLYDIDFTENETDHTYRKELEQLAEEKEKSISISCSRRQIRNQPARSIVIM